MLKLEISYQSYIISPSILVFFSSRGFFEDYIFCNGEIFLSFHNSSFALRYFFKVNGEAKV